MNQISNIKFVNTWCDAVNKAAGVKYVAEKMDMTIESASAKANNLRTKGVELPRMPHLNKNDSIEDLNALIARKIEA